MEAHVTNCENAKEFTTRLSRGCTTIFHRFYPITTGTPSTGRPGNEVESGHNKSSPRTRGLLCVRWGNIHSGCGLRRNATNINMPLLFIAAPVGKEDAAVRRPATALRLARALQDRHCKSVGKNSERTKTPEFHECQCFRVHRTEIVDANQTPRIGSARAEIVMMRAYQGEVDTLSLMRGKFPHQAKHMPRSLCIPCGWVRAGAAGAVL